MIDFDEMEKTFEVDYSENNYDTLFVRRKLPTKENSPLYLIFKGMSLRDAVKIAKENNVKIQYCYDVDGEDDVELIELCKNLNDAIEGFY